MLFAKIADFLTTRVSDLGLYAFVPLPHMSSPLFAVIDLETTGGQPPVDRITEIAIHVTDGEQVLDSFSTLVNPERPIPYMVSQITGITNAMVAEAPRFYEVARQIVEITEGKIFVAHNVGFDYSFLKAAFYDLGYAYQRKTLCTIRLSRKLIPGLPSYSLGRLCGSIGIPVTDRHRATGDAAATTELLKLLLRKNRDEALNMALESELRTALLPPKIKKADVDALPHATGVYYFHNDAGQVLYVGKSLDIHKRVQSHFTVDFRRKGLLQLRDQLASVTWELTGSELIALLLESSEIQRLLPPFNKAQRVRGQRVGIYQEADTRGYMRLRMRHQTVSNNEAKHPPLILLGSYTRAKSFIERITREHSLCPRLMGLEGGGARTSAKPCFERHLHRCQGACIGEESAESYNARLQAALHELAYPHASFLVLGRGRNANERSLVLVEAHRYRGFAFVDDGYAPRNVEEVRDLIHPREDTSFTRAIIRGYLMQPHMDRLVPLLVTRLNHFV